MSLPRLLTRVCHSLLHLLRLVFFLFVFEFVPMFLFSVQMENGRTEKPIAAIVTWCRSFVLFGKWDWMTLHSGSCILHHVGCQCAECRHRFIIYQIERPKQILCTYPLWDMKLWQNETRKKNEKYEQRMHDPCKYLNCANEENGWMRRMCENDGEKTHPFQFPHNPANCRAANVPSWAFAKSISVHWIVRRSTIGMSKSIIPHRSLCRAERGEAGTHAPANASLFEWLWCLPSFQNSRSLPHRCLGDCLWFIIEPISREISLRNRIRTDNEKENVRHVDGEAYQVTHDDDNAAQYRPSVKKNRLDIRCFELAPCFQYW